MTRRGVALALLALALLLPAAAPARPAPRTTLTAVESEVMCVVCGVPLNVAESPQAERERDLIRHLIAQGRTKDQIKQALVGQYGDQVLALPRRDGFNLAVYLVPLAVVAALAAALAVAVPRWRRGGRIAAAAAAARPAAAPTPLDAADARRLDEDLAHYDR